MNKYDDLIKRWEKIAIADCKDTEFNWEDEHIGGESINALREQQDLVAEQYDDNVDAVADLDAANNRITELEAMRVRDAKLINPATGQRYDDVYNRGVAWLESGDSDE